MSVAPPDAVVDSEIGDVDDDEGVLSVDSSRETCPG